jgi:hypothetical protein
MDDGVGALVGLSARRAVRARLPSASVSVGRTAISPPHLCDEHRDEDIKQVAAGIPNLNRP